MDSSSDEADDYLVTNVTLGYVSNEPTSDEVSHVGGYSDWLDTTITHQPNLQDVGSAMVSCLCCSSCMRIYNTSSQTMNDDCICSAAGREHALGRLEAPQDHEPSSTGRELGNALFGTTQPSPTQTSKNPFSMNSGSTPSSHIFPPLSSTSSSAAVPSQTPTNEIEPPSETFAQKLQISSSATQPSNHEPEPWPSQTTLPAPFKFFHLDADAEELEPNPSQSKSPSGPSNAAQIDLDDPSSSTIPEKDNFESSIDKTFQKFSDRIAQNPDQILRYEFKGSPLLYSGHDDVATRFIVPHNKAGAIRGIPHCETCGSERVFELQLVPGLIYELEKDDPVTLDDGMEWGTIILGVCSKNCGETGTVSFREEWVGVQWEERIVKS